MGQYWRHEFAASCGLTRRPPLQGSTGYWRIRAPSAGTILLELKPATLKYSKGKPTGYVIPKAAGESPPRDLAPQRRSTRERRRRAV